MKSGLRNNQAKLEVDTSVAPEHIRSLTTKAPSWWGIALRRFARQRVPLVAALVLMAITLLAIFAPVVAPFDPTQQFRAEGIAADGRPVPPNAKFMLGTDTVGRDLLSRIIWGARISLAIGLVSSFLATMIAVFVGGVSGLLGGTADLLIMRFVDLLMSVPVFFLQLLMVAVFRPSIVVTVIVIVAFSWTYGARVFRSQVISLREQDYITATRSLGMNTFSIFRRHILPHLLPLIILQATLSIPGAIFTEAGLSFLSLGVPPPTPTWGAMIQDGTSLYRAAPWVLIFPGITMLVTIVCINLTGMGLRSALDPTVGR